MLVMVRSKGIAIGQSNPGQLLELPECDAYKAVTVGCVAQLVEQLTLNQRVQGSSPCSPTNSMRKH